MDRKTNYQQIGKRIKEVREAKKLTQAQLAEKLHAPLTATAISLYENGEREVSVDVLTEIAKRNNFVVKKGLPDIDRSARLVLKDWQKGLIKKK